MLIIFLSFLSFFSQTTLQNSDTTFLEDLYRIQYLDTETYSYKQNLLLNIQNKMMLALEVYITSSDKKLNIGILVEPDNKYSIDLSQYTLDLLHN